MRNTALHRVSDASLAHAGDVMPDETTVVLWRNITFMFRADGTSPACARGAGDCVDTLCGRRQYYQYRLNSSPATDGTTYAARAQRPPVPPLPASGGGARSIACPTPPSAHPFATTAARTRCAHFMLARGDGRRWRGVAAHAHALPPRHRTRTHHAFTAPRASPPLLQLPTFRAFFLPYQALQLLRDAAHRLSHCLKLEGQEGGRKGRGRHARRMGGN